MPSLHKNFPNYLKMWSQDFEQSLDYRHEMASHLRHIAQQAGERIAQCLNERQHLQIETKGRNDYVTNIDKELDAFIVSELKRLYPDIPAISEEGNPLADTPSGYFWVIDPIDGTTNFIHNAGPVAVSIGLMEVAAHQRTFPLGVIHEVTRHETFSAVRDGGAFCNGMPIHATACQHLAEAFVATGFPYQDYGKLADLMRLLEYVIAHSTGVRRLGSAATDIAYVAAGRFDAFYEYGLHLWDIAAGIAIAQEAGARFCDFRGGANYTLATEVVCAAPQLLPELVEPISRLMVR